MSFTDKVAVVTGGGSGIGRATCRLLAAAGAAVAVVDIDGEAAASAAADIAAERGVASHFEVDVADPSGVQRLAERVAAEWSAVHVLVNCAAVMRFASVMTMTLEDWERVVAVDLTGPFLMCRAFLPLMPTGAAVVNVGSVHSRRTTANVAPYAASKAGLEAFTRALAIEQLERGVRVTCVVPGSVDTPMLWSNPNLASGAETLTGPVADAADVASAICFLASDEARAITGSSLVVDNGLLSQL